MEVLQKEIDDARALPEVTLKDMGKLEVLKKPLIVAVMLMIAQQFSGINAAMYYSTEIFKLAGVTDNNALYCTIGMGLVNVVTTIVSIILVERVGRKILLLGGMAGMAVLSLILVIAMSLKDVWSFAAFISVAAVFGFVICFAIGLGPIPWFIVLELFTQNSRSLASSIAVFVNWSGNFIVSIGFIPLMTMLKNFSFLIFFVLLIVFLVFTYLKVPETRGKTIDEIQEYFLNGNKNAAGLS